MPSCSFLHALSSARETLRELVQFMDHCHQAKLGVNQFKA